MKKNEYPIFRALATEVNESSAIVPCERNNLSRDNLLNSSDNLTTNEHDADDSDGSGGGGGGGSGGVRKIDTCTSDVVILLDKSLSQQQHLSRDTITFETEKKHQQQQQKQQHSPSSKTPLLYAKKNVQSYQEQQPQQQQQQLPQPINEQFQQKSMATTTDFNGFYNIPTEDVVKLNEVDDFIEQNASSSLLDNSPNPFFNSTTEEFNTVKESSKGNLIN